MGSSDGRKWCVRRLRCWCQSRCCPTVLRCHAGGFLSLTFHNIPDEVLIGEDLQHIDLMRVCHAVCKKFKAQVMLSGAGEVDQGPRGSRSRLANNGRRSEGSTFMT